MHHLFHADFLIPHLAQKTQTAFWTFLLMVTNKLNFWWYLWFYLVKITRKHGQKCIENTDSFPHNSHVQIHYISLLHLTGSTQHRFKELKKPTFFWVALPVPSFVCLQTGKGDLHFLLCLASWFWMGLADNSAISQPGNISVLLHHQTTSCLYLSNATVHYSVLQYSAWNILLLHHFIPWKGQVKSRIVVLMTKEKTDIWNRPGCGKYNKLMKQYGIRSTKYESCKTKCWNSSLPPNQARPLLNALCYGNLSCNKHDIVLYE
jgi:hypothetical protein